jgi:subtilisin family serine protease
MIRAIFAVVGIVSLAWSQAIPSRYIVELSGEPSGAVQGALLRAEPSRRLSDLASHRLVAESRAEIARQQRTARTAIEARGGRVLSALDTTLNALIVESSSAETLRAIPGVLRVTQDRLVHARLDHALPLNGVINAINRVGADKAGAGIRVAILDSGIDASHPGFQDDTLVPPDGFPRTSSDTNQKHVSNKVIVARSYESLADGGYGGDARDRNGHGTNAACAAACVNHNAPVGRISGAAPKAFLGSYKVLGDNGSGPTSAILNGIDDAVKDGFDVLNLSLGDELTGKPEDDVQVKALNKAAEAGAIIVCAAGNEGPDDNSINSPGFAEKVISVGSSANDRTFDDSANPTPSNPNRISDFSSRGPSLSVNLKPDMVAVGDNFYTASSTVKDPQTYYTVTQGTSFATPTVAGAAAVLKSARPGLTAAQYRSLLVNSSTGLSGSDSNPIPVRSQGAGRLNLVASLDQPVAIEPVSINFRQGDGSPNLKRDLTVTNVGSAAVNLTLTVQSFDGKNVPVIEGKPTAPLPPQAAGTITVQFSGSAITGESQGLILIANDANAVVARVPYWYAAPANTAASLTVFKAPASAAAGETAIFFVRVVDGSGIAFSDNSLNITPTSGGGSVAGLEVYPDSPNTYVVAVKIGREGENVFQLKSGSVTRNVTIGLKQ